MEETTEQQQNIKVQQLFPTSSSVQKPQNIWSGSQKQSYPQSAHGNTKTSGFIQMWEEMHPEVTVPNAFRVLKCYGPALPLPLSNLSSFHRQGLDQDQCSEHRCCDPGLNFTGAWWEGEGKVERSPHSPPRPFRSVHKGLQLFPRGLVLLMGCLWQILQNKLVSLPDPPTSTHCLRFWACWRWPWIYQAAWAPHPHFFFDKRALGKSLLLAEYHYKSRITIFHREPL